MPTPVNPAAMALPIGAVPNPDPTVRTVEQFLREISSSREISEAKSEGDRRVLETRLNGMDKAIELLQGATDKIPAQIQDEVQQLQALHDEKFSSVAAQVETRFGGIATQFAERDKRTEQLSLADKTAIAAALQAQKEDASAKNESNATATAKMENNFAKLIEQGQTLLMEVRRNTEAQINDLKSRLDKGEGKSSIADPATVQTQERMAAAIHSLSASRDTSSGHARGAADNVAMLIGIGGFVIGLGSLAILGFRLAAGH